MVIRCPAWEPDYFVLDGEEDGCRFSVLEGVRNGRVGGEEGFRVLTRVEVGTCVSVVAGYA